MLEDARSKDSVPRLDSIMKSISQIEKANFNKIHGALGLRFGGVYFSPFC